MKNMQKGLFYGCGLTLLTPLAVSGQAAAEKPNVLFILTDQQSFHMMSCAGNAYLSTPAMDRIARDGYRMERMYCTNPVSMPSRFSLITGRYTTDVGIRSNQPAAKTDRERVLSVVRESSIGNLFRAAGYRTLYSGKTHLYGTRDLTEYGFELHGTDPYDGPAEYAEAFFGNFREDGPFLLVLSFMNPHDICYQAGFDPRFPDKLKPDQRAATQKYLDLYNTLGREEYRRQVPPVPANVQPNGVFRPVSKSGSGSGSRDWTPEQWDFYRWMYHRLTEEVDGQIGRALAALDRAGLTGNTIVVFTSDHGDMCQSHGLVHKSELLEEAQRVPFLVMGPGIRRGVDAANLVCGFDFAPTVCDLAGIGVPENLPGVSLKPLLTGQTDRIDRNYIVVEAGAGYQIHDGRYKYSIYTISNRPEKESLRDIAVDPGELKELSADPAHAAKKRELRALLVANLKSRNGLMPIDRKAIPELE